MTYIHFQTDETACQAGPWLCRRCRQQNSSSLDKASRSVGIKLSSERQMIRSFKTESKRHSTLISSVTFRVFQIAQFLWKIQVWRAQIRTYWRRCGAFSSSDLPEGETWGISALWWYWSVQFSKQQESDRLHIQTAPDIFKLLELRPNLKNPLSLFSVPWKGLLWQFIPIFLKTSQENMTLETVRS